MVRHLSKKLQLQYRYRGRIVEFDAVSGKRGCGTVPFGGMENDEFAPQYVHVAQAMRPARRRRTSASVTSTGLLRIFGCMQA